ncbi:hypothetical protein HXY33_06900 [Candidatus Bathyarchaeota archaeon]|nr:hypothetical protein [Candidatus Bathyarchaeota archaeon]
MKKKEPIMTNQNRTCPNPSCGKVFSNPIKAENLRSKNIEVYDACPFCLTEITLDKDSGTDEEKKDFEDKSKEKEYAKAETSGELLPKVQGCQHHLGYLSQRSQKEKIPEECMVCENIVQCMLKNVTS